MEDNTNTNVDVNINDGADQNKDAATTNNNTDTDATVTMSQADFDKKIQSECDKVRGKYTKEIKDLQEQVKKLTPVEKTPDQIALEERIAKLEQSEKDVAEKQKRLDFQERLTTKGLDKNLVDFVSDGADVDKFAEIIENIVKDRAKKSGYVPGDHTSEDKVTAEEFAKMTYSQKVDLSQKSPELFKRLSGRR